MERIPVQSSIIIAVGYDYDNAILEIEFKDGKLYEYYDVPQYEYDSLISAESIGSYANKHIFKVYRQQRIS